VCVDYSYTVVATYSRPTVFSKYDVPAYAFVLADTFKNDSQTLFTFYHWTFNNVSITLDFLNHTVLIYALIYT